MQEKRHDCVVEMWLCFFSRKAGDYKMLFVATRKCRSTRRMLESCQLKGKYALNPIIDWSEDEVWLFIHQYVKKYCQLYDKGFRRLGCIGCPLASVKQRKWELSLYPQYRRAYLRAFEKILKDREEDGNYNRAEQWKTPEDIYKWWLYGSDKPMKQIEGQIEMELAS